MSENKVYSPTLQGKDVLEKLNKDFKEKSPNFYIVDLELTVEETAALLLNKSFQQCLKEHKTFKDYFLIVLDNNMKTWKDKPDIEARFGAFKISQRFFEDKEILSDLHDFEKSIIKK